MPCDVLVDGWPCGRLDPHDEADLHNRPGNVYTEPYWSTVVKPWQKARAEQIARLRENLAYHVGVTNSPASFIKITDVGA